MLRCSPSERIILEQGKERDLRQVGGLWAFRTDGDIVRSAFGPT